jgi:hypothetical protein
MWSNPMLAAMIDEIKVGHSLDLDTKPAASPSATVASR